LCFTNKIAHSHELKCKKSNSELHAAVLLGDDAAYVMKLYHPNPAIFDSGQRKKLARQFIDASRIQQDLAAESERWCPLVRNVYTDTGAAYLAESYDCSLEELIVGYFEIDDQMIHKIVIDIIDGLIVLKKKFKRQHGNLKPSNVLCRQDKHGKWAFALTDPLADSEFTGTIQDEDDIVAIGELIFKMITHSKIASC